MVQFQKTHLTLIIHKSLWIITLINLFLWSYDKEDPSLKVYRKDLLTISRLKKWKIIMIHLLSIEDNNPQ